MTGLTQVEVQNLIKRGVIIPPKPCEFKGDPKHTEYTRKYRERNRKRIRELANIRYHEKRKKEASNALQHS